MLDRKFIIENVDRIKANCAQRGVKCDVDRLGEMEAARRQKLLAVEEANRKANDFGVIDCIRIKFPQMPGFSVRVRKRLEVDDEFE